MSSTASPSTSLDVDLAHLNSIPRVLQTEFRKRTISLAVSGPREPLRRQNRLLQHGIGLITGIDSPALKEVIQVCRESGSSNPTLDTLRGIEESSKSAKVDPLPDTDETWIAIEETFRVQLVNYKSRKPSREVSEQTSEQEATREERIALNALKDAAIWWKVAGLQVYYGTLEPSKESAESIQAVLASFDKAKSTLDLKDPVKAKLDNYKHLLEYELKRMTDNEENLVREWFPSIKARQFSIVHRELGKPLGESAPPVWSIYEKLNRFKIWSQGERAKAEAESSAGRDSSLSGAKTEEQKMEEELWQYFNIADGETVYHKPKKKRESESSDLGPLEKARRLHMDVISMGI